MSDWGQLDGLVFGEDLGVGADVFGILDYLEPFGLLLVFLLIFLLYFLESSFIDSLEVKNVIGVEWQIFEVWLELESGGLVGFGFGIFGGDVVFVEEVDHVVEAFVLLHDLKL